MVKVRSVAGFSVVLIKK